MAKSRIAHRREQARGERSERYQARREALAVAAAQVFAAKGYSASSLDEIAKLADIERASLYYYVGSKKELFYEVVAEHIHRNTDTAEAILASDKSPREKLADLISQLIASYERHYPSLYVFIQEDLGTILGGKSGAGRRLKESMLRFNEVTVEIIQGGIDSGDFRPDIPANVAAFSVIGMVNWTHRWFRPGGGMSGEEVGRLFASIACDGMTPRQRGR